MSLIFFETIDSTNTYVKKNIDHLADRDVVYANNQTAGRGRFDRIWTDLGAENIYMTFVLRPSDTIKGVYANLTQYLSVCLCKELEELGLKTQIKWPNDVLLNGHKVSGILAETVVSGGKLKGIALGIGVNLNASRVDLSQIDRPATSVNLELWENVDRDDFMKKLIDRFFAGYGEFLNGGFKLIKEDYVKRANSFFEDYCSPLEGRTPHNRLNTDYEGGKKSHGNFEGGYKIIKIAIFDKVKEGKYSDFTDGGELILLDSSNQEHIINMGEIV